jgi:Arc/MetJ family transcription regulator
MRTNIVLDDKLMEEAFSYADHISTKTMLVKEALQEYVATRKRKNLKDLRGKIQFRDDYDYKAMREHR